MANQKSEQTQKIIPFLQGVAMNNRTRISLIVVAAIWMYVGLAVVGPATSFAEEVIRKVTSPRQVSSTFSISLRARLNDKRNKLLGRLDVLRMKFNQFSQGECTTGVKEGSTADSYCQATYDRLNSQLDVYDADAKKFNARIAFEEGKVMLLGYAFKMGVRMRAYAHQSLTSIKDMSRILIGVWYAERGDYQRARHLVDLPNMSADALQEMDELLLSLERKKRALLKKEILRTVMSGDFNSRLFSRYPHEFSLSLLRAHLSIKSGNYDEAMKQIALARGMNIESPSLAEAELYIRQMKASMMEKQSPPTPALIKNQENMAGAYAGWKLGMLLMDADMGTPAALILGKSARTLAREGDIDDSKTVFRLANKIPEGEGKSKISLPSSGIYDGVSEANILLDALEYGQHNWQRSMQFLELAHKALPGNERISEAIAHVQALMASQR
jgi:hypothetical protein